MSIVASNIIISYSSKRQKLADEMDLLDESYNNDSMDADLDPNEEDMLDVVPEETEDTIVDEDFEMEEMYLEPGEEIQDIDLDDAVDPKTNTIEKSASAATAKGEIGDGYSKPELGDAPDLSDLIDYADEQELNPPANASRTDQVHHSTTDQGRTRNQDETSSEALNNDLSGDGTITANDSPRINGGTANQETSPTTGFEEAHIHDEISEASSVHHIHENLSVVGGLKVSDSASLQPDRNEVAGNDLEDLSKGRIPTGPVQQGGLGEEQSEKVSTKDSRRVGYEENDDDLASAMQHPHPITILFQETEMSLFPPSNSDVESAETFLLQDVNLATEPLKALFEACRSLVGESIDEYCELEMQFHDLELTISETHISSANTTLVDLLTVYLNLQHNDGVSDPGPLYVELSSKPDFSRQLLYLEASALEGKGLTECLSKDLSENGNSVLSEASESGTQRVNVSTTTLNGEEEAEKSLYNNGNLRSDHHKDALSTHLTPPSSEPVVPVETLKAAESSAAKLHISDEGKKASPRRALDPEANTYTEDLPEHEVDKGRKGSSMNHQPEHEVDVGRLRQESNEEGEAVKSSAGSSTLQGEIPETEEGLTEELEDLEVSNELYVDEGEIGDSVPQPDIDTSHDSAGHSSSNQYTDYTEVSINADVPENMRSIGDKMNIPIETQDLEHHASGDNEPHPQDDVHTAGDEAQANESTQKAGEMDQDVDYGQEYDNNDYSAETPYQEWLEEGIDDHSDYEQPEQDPVGSLHDTSVRHASGAEETPSSQENLQESKELKLFEDKLDKGQKPSSDPIDATSEVSKPTALPDSNLQPSTPNSRKRPLQSDEEEYLIEDFEITPKRVKST